MYTSIMLMRALSLFLSSTFYLVVAAVGELVLPVVELFYAGPLRVLRAPSVLVVDSATVERPFGVPTLTVLLPWPAAALPNCLPKSTVPAGLEPPGCVGLPNFGLRMPSEVALFTRLRALDGAPVAATLVSSLAASVLARARFFGPASLAIFVMPGMGFSSLFLPVLRTRCDYLVLLVAALFGSGSVVP